MKKHLTIALAAISLTALALSGCSMGSGSPGSDRAASGSGADSSGTTSSSAEPLKTASTSLGTIVVDGAGMTVYFYDKDAANSGKSACSGTCLAAWPPVTAKSTSPKVTGVSGKVGTITATNGKTQITLNGLPLYTYAPDAAAGDVTGQGVQGVWWVVSPAGTKITTKASDSSDMGY